MASLQIESAQKLILAGADVHKLTRRNISTLIEVCRYEDLTLLKALLEKKVDVNTRDDGGTIALHKAAGWGRVEACKLLLAERADINACSNFGQTLLMRAGERFHTECFKYLLDQGAETSLEDMSGFTIFDYCRDFPPI